MRDELKQLYQDTILDHGRKPRNFRVIEDADRQQEGFNPVCGDRLTLFLKLNADNYIEDISFQGVGCAISMASASLMTITLQGKHIDEATAIFQQFHQLVTHHTLRADNTAGAEHKQEEPDMSMLNKTKLRVLAGVSEFPSRVKCATLAWHALDHAINTSDKTSGERVSTE
ncbi:MAG: SUF system NifU family Fe-S cluster assembly protein [Gammaproteobacteria bacterium]